MMFQAWSSTWLADKEPSLATQQAQYQVLDQLDQAELSLEEFWSNPVDNLVHSWHGSTRRSLVE